MIDLLTPEEQAQLLGRPVAALLTPADRQHYTGRRCLITGAGGSIGSELARQLADCGPERLALVDHCEHALFQIEREIAERWPGVGIDPILCDISRGPAVRNAVRRARPSMVFHAAAYKHVPMAERAICAAVRVNVLGTGEVLAAAREAAARFILISSDKAVAPRSVMGATKRLAELLVLTRCQRPAAAVVRFGNVLVSRGNFVETTLDRIRRGRPIQLTAPDATRFFMTAGEAAALVLKSALLARGGDTFWLDMGRPIRVGDLADRLLDVAEARGWERVPIEIVGLRSGEKLAERLAVDGFAMGRSRDPRIWVARRSVAPPECEDAVSSLGRLVGRDDALGALEGLAAIVDDYEPSAEAWACARLERTFLHGRIGGGVRTA